MSYLDYKDYNRLLKIVMIYSFILFALHIGFDKISQYYDDQEMYEKREWYRENLSCNDIEVIVESTGKWGHGEREYVNSLWIAKECWKR